MLGMENFWQGDNNFEGLDVKFLDCWVDGLVLNEMDELKFLRGRLKMVFFPTKMTIMQKWSFMQEDVEKQGGLIIEIMPSW